MGNDPRTFSIAHKHDNATALERMKNLFNNELKTKIPNIKITGGFTSEISGSFTVKGVATSTVEVALVEGVVKFSVTSTSPIVLGVISNQIETEVTNCLAQ